MEIDLSPEDQEAIQFLLSTGKYADEQAVIHAALLYYKDLLEKKRAAPQSEGEPDGEESALPD